MEAIARTVLLVVALVSVITVYLPFAVKPGRCPPIKAKCKLTLPPPGCHSDSDCRGLKKCCNICGNRCMYPAPEPAGICPRNAGETLEELSCPSVECSRDSDCPATEKCCTTGGVQKCVTPVKPGRCPPIKAKCKLTLPPPGCHSDSDCRGLKKCCNICGNRCMKPAPEPAGICPRNAGETLEELSCPSVECSRDSDCPATEKCCTTGGMQKCVTPDDEDG
ncbi:perlwapin-like isoform X2 [Dendropsophus ebraccatus]|uniref:perlwapin-like isoform X2 n=1 Tax=Dendropsophus ebraccatus TaxID=150705 RepID=UPI0038319739